MFLLPLVEFLQSQEVEAAEALPKVSPLVSGFCLLIPYIYTIMVLRDALLFFNQSISIPIRLVASYGVQRKLVL